MVRKFVACAGVGKRRGRVKEGGREGGGADWNRVAIVLTCVLWAAGTYFRFAPRLDWSKKSTIGILRT